MNKKEQRQLIEMDILMAGAIDKIIAVREALLTLIAESKEKADLRSTKVRGFRRRICKEVKG